MVVEKDLETEIIERLKQNVLVRIPASESQYLELANRVPFKIEYHESEIYTMGLASIVHETISAMFATILNNLYAESDEFLVLGSNSGVHIPKFEGGYYMPDVTVIKDKPLYKKGSNSIITNPYLIVEVLYPTTGKFDLESKLPEYKHLESIQQIILVNQKKVEVSSFIRSESANTWINQDFYKLSDQMLIDNHSVSIESIYRKVRFSI